MDYSKSKEDLDYLSQRVLCLCPLKDWTKNRADKKEPDPLTERKAMIMKYRNRANVGELCKWAKVAKSSFHYKASSSNRGIIPNVIKF